MVWVALNGEFNISWYLFTGEVSNSLQETRQHAMFVWGGSEDRKRHRLLNRSLLSFVFKLNEF